ncbi:MULTISPECIES: hypothetical protein [unclassified Streptomyces]|uniref:hypothetical protein n=1 Tax=unclassified Streptomyces TaxID=2593676 RepID=UPI001319D980|nr:MULTISPECIES: hypothetical protein [unclassified Streptomyces]MYT33310.1 hypothetical protein [Streptomyces sp. SID8354]
MSTAYQQQGQRGMSGCRGHSGTTGKHAGHQDPPPYAVKPEQMFFLGEHKWGTERKKFTRWNPTQASSKKSTASR